MVRHMKRIGKTEWNMVWDHANLMTGATRVAGSIENKTGLENADGKMDTKVIGRMGRRTE